ncbi:MtnX-like HAD-IB family phosphatase [Evansella cellulosilytica]|uniref:2,3-diketo-5-methylthio-1-phosphopentane phosphatase n=1 Tax=Evansella cellulosilytica (strain ATCC 21833 / DSM 2522 / FERM P-1141 / JCM 9156 / N-4) TaxID=649639 RepID=E6TQI2_EVAC2|nr:MtnX-like HAD-IB family phosphatase [Evansella cellulosilytica]ADU30493.1 2,3-diketo-5-methylthio-1-phosphopentane phosphatase [Evansella cellulosilytica DSM 2522]
MGKWAFVSDFDGTISKQDFYWMVIEKYFPEGNDLYKKWKAAVLKDIDFLSAIFTSIHQEEKQIVEDILSLPIDEYVPTFIENVQKNGGDFYILSAGTDYYINHVLKKYDIKNVEVFSNEGYFKDNNVHMNIDEKNWHYSERYGIDKAKVIKKLKEKYDTIYFAGDSEPDTHPAKFATMTFAKDALKELLRSNDVPFVPYENFTDIENYLIKHGEICK